MTLLGYGTKFHVDPNKGRILGFEMEMSSANENALRGLKQATYSDYNTHTDSDWSRIMSEADYIYKSDSSLELLSAYREDLNQVYDNAEEIISLSTSHDEACPELVTNASSYMRQKRIMQAIYRAQDCGQLLVNPALTTDQGLHVSLNLPYDSSRFGMIGYGKNKGIQFAIVEELGSDRDYYHGLPTQSFEPLRLVLNKFKPLFEVLGGRKQTGFCRYDNSDRGAFNFAYSRLELRFGIAGKKLENLAMLYFASVYQKRLFKTFTEKKPVTKVLPTGYDYPNYFTRTFVHVTVSEFRMLLIYSLIDALKYMVKNSSRSNTLDETKQLLRTLKSSWKAVKRNLGGMSVPLYNQERVLKLIEVELAGIDAKLSELAPSRTVQEVEEQVIEEAQEEQTVQQLPIPAPVVVGGSQTEGVLFEDIVQDAVVSAMSARIVDEATVYTDPVNIWQLYENQVGTTPSYVVVNTPQAS